MFFTVLWRGVCQALGWFFGLFGYKRDGKFAKCVWGLFALSATIIVGSIAAIIIYEAGDEMYKKYLKNHCYNPGCYESTQIYHDVYFHGNEYGKGYIYNSRSEEKTVKQVAWIAMPRGKDSLVCFSDGQKRGYFSKNTGRVVVEPKYDHAWVFSEGLASVDDNGWIKFIDATGEVVIDNKMAYIPDMEGYVFHGGYCVVDADGGEQCGMMDKTGNIVLPLEYSSICPTNDFKFWLLQKGEKMAVLDENLKSVLPLMECSIYIDEGTIDVTMPDHTMRKYDMQGTLINDFYVSNVRMLEYEKDEILYRTETHDDDGGEYAVPFVDSYHPKATARLRAYVAGDGHEGLMTASGHVVTMPLYENIEALDYDLYLCTSTNYDKVVVNGKGEIVR